MCYSYNQIEINKLCGEYREHGITTRMLLISMLFFYGCIYIRERRCDGCTAGGIYFRINNKPGCVDALTANDEVAILFFLKRAVGTIEANNNQIIKEVIYGKVCNGIGCGDNK